VVSQVTETIGIILGLLAALGLWALMAGNFIDAIRRAKKAEKPKDEEPDQ
jgi:type III secretory pathway component EscT